jgi:hypothetical protein
MAMLQGGIAIAISVAYGPEIIAAMEVTALLEVLGAGLFLTAYAAGAKLAAARLWRAICRMIIPVAQMSVIRSNASGGERALASLYVAAHASWYILFALAVFMYGQHVVQVAT